MTSPADDDGLADTTGEVPLDPSPRGGMPARTRELRAQGKKTMRKLLDAGMEVFDKRGYHVARVDDVVKLAETSHGTFYLYFSSKEDLLLTLIGDVSDEMMRLIDELPPIDSSSEGYQALRDWLETFEKASTYYGPVLRAWTEAQMYVDEFARMGGKVLGGFVSRLEGRIAEANPKDELDARVAALALVAMIERFNYLSTAMREEFDDDAYDTLAAIIHAGLFGGTRGERKLFRRRSG